MAGSIGLPELLIIGVIIGLLALSVLALFMLFRLRPESDLTLVLWVLVIVAVPVLGPLAYFLSQVIHPTSGRRGNEKGRHV